MLPFNKLPITFNTDDIANNLIGSDLWGEVTKRTEGNSPHRESLDIWVRFLDPKQCEKNNDWSMVGKPHKSEWLKDIPKIKSICSKLMEFTNGEKLGGVLLTKLEPNCKILPHVDSGWHAEYYDKYYVAIKNGEGASFFFDDGVIEPHQGDVYAFRNDVNHWVENNSNETRIALIVCIKQSKLSKEGLCLGDMQPPQ